MSRYQRQPAWKRSVLATAVCLLWLISPGCRRDEPASPAGGAGAGQTGGPGSTAGGNRGPGADAQDHPDAPRALPKTNEIADWIKTEPVARCSLDQLAQEDSRWKMMRTFRFRSAARCAYESEETREQAAVLFIEAATCDDAFGIFSLLTPRPGKLSEDGVIRATDTTPAGTEMFGWHGKACVMIRFDGPAGEHAEPSRTRLFEKILFDVPAGDDIPLLLRILPPDKLAGTKTWLVRSVAALALSGDETLRGMDAAAMDARLGLDGEAILSVAAVAVAGDEPRNLVWLVQYDDEADAAAAYKRCRDAPESAGSELDRNTLIDEPKGTFFVGSWTAGQESIQNLLPVLCEALPDAN